MILDPLHPNLFPAQVLGSLEGVPTGDVGLAWWVTRGVVTTMLARGVSTNALVHKPQVILDPHSVIDLQDDSCGVWIKFPPRKSSVFKGVISAQGFTGDVI